MSEKLTIEQLAPYLPYELKVQTVHGSIYNTKSCTLDLMLMLFSGYGFNNIKPILRPMIDLTQEIEHNGERFVPIQRLYNQYEENEFSGANKTKRAYDAQVYDYGQMYGLFSVMYKTHEGCEYSFGYDVKLRRFIIRDETRGLPKATAYQIDLFNKLFSWHFDVFGLIEKDLAININTLKL